MPVRGLLDPDCWGRGYGREQLARLVEAAFRDLDVAAYATECARENDRSRRMIEAVVVGRFGGRHEGLLRRYKARSTGEVTDQHRSSLLREEYEAATG